MTKPPPDWKSIDPAFLSVTLPNALALARQTGRHFKVKTEDGLRECEQAACVAVLEALPAYNPSQGPLDVYLWKWVVGAVTKLLRRDRPHRRAGSEEALDEAEKVRDVSDPFRDADDEAERLKAYLRSVTLARAIGITRMVIAKSPEDALLRAEAFRGLEVALGVLTDELKSVITLRYWAGLTWDQVGLAIGRSGRQAKRIDREIRGRLLRELRLRDVDEHPDSE